MANGLLFRGRGLTLTAGLLSVCGSVSAVTVNFAGPCIDRWVYPFNTESGYRSAASTFSALGQENAFPPLSFDQRDAQLLVGFDTDAPGSATCPNEVVPAGLAACDYRVTSAVIMIAVSTDQAFPFDPTYDAWTSYATASNPGAVDADAGRPIELYGVGFRGGYTSATYFEGTPSVPGPPFGPDIQSDVRYAYPTDAANGMTRDVSNNVRDLFDPAPFAVGQSPVAAGALVPANTDITFTLNVAVPDVQRYLRQSVADGRLRFMLTSLQPAASSGGPGAGQYATFYTKENLFGAGRAARLSITVDVRTKAGDINFDGSVNGADLSVLLGEFGQTTGLPAADLNCDGAVNGADLSVLLANFGS